jgi:peroxiredoxin Q/BCP
VTFQVGREAPPFELEDTAGRTHRLADYRGRWLLLVFHRHLH